MGQPVAALWAVATLLAGLAAVAVHEPSPDSTLVAGDTDPTPAELTPSPPAPDEASSATTTSTEPPPTTSSTTTSTSTRPLSTSTTLPPDPIAPAVPPRSVGIRGGGLHIVSADGATIHHLGHELDGREVDVVWAPDAASLFVARRSTDPSGATSHALTQHQLDGTSIELASLVATNELSVTDSGRYLVRSIARTHSEAIDLRSGATRRIDAAVTTPLDGRDVVVDRFGMAYGLDGSNPSNMAFASGSLQAHELHVVHGGDRVIAVTDTQVSWFDGAALRQVTMDGGYRNGVAGCAVARDGGEVACPLYSETAGASVIVVDLGSGTVRRIPGAHAVTYSPTGDLIYAIERENQWAQAIVVETAEGTRDLVSSVPLGGGLWATPVIIDWSPDGTWLALTATPLRPA